MRNEKSVQPAQTKEEQKENQKDGAVNDGGTFHRPVTTRQSDHGDQETGCREKWYRQKNHHP